MSNDKILNIIEIEFYFIIALTIMFPAILPGYPLSLIDTLIRFPKNIDPAFSFLIYILFIAPLLDLLTIYLIKTNKIFKSALKRSKNMFALGMATGILIYGILLELLVLLDAIDAPFLIYFTTIAILGYFYYKYF